MSVIGFARLRAVPWKNGLGITREIQVEPAGATMDDFLWRASIAEVDTASPFSVFPGIDRTIVLLDGNGFTMTLDENRVHALTTPCVPFAFAGESRVEVALAGGATRDFNLMVRRSHARGHVDVERGPAMLEHQDVALLHLARGHAEVDGVACVPGDSAIGPRTVRLAADAVALCVRVVLLTR
ncbi:HutD family protein [Luteibacter sp. ME-Dv--P-043b]|uniref:HutD/Ves family protein n=1 Tax=unclassified Luteibacter TaxID=2620188 RepID=UPI00255765AF|nr:HutD family protein [Luteibacter sp. ME-Dv--P-043b]